MKRLVYVLLAAVVVSTCGGDGEPAGPAPVPKPNVSGQWAGMLETSHLNLVLNHDTLSNRIEGSGTLKLAGGAAAEAVTATGNFASNTVSLTIRAEGFQPMNFIGAFLTTQLFGNINGSGYVNAPVTLVKG